MAAAKMSRGHASLSLSFSLVLSLCLCHCLVRFVVVSFKKIQTKPYEPASYEWKTQLQAWPRPPERPFTGAPATIQNCMPRRGSIGHLDCLFARVSGDLVVGAKNRFKNPRRLHSGRPLLGRRITEEGVSDVKRPLETLPSLAIGARVPKLQKRKTNFEPEVSSRSSRLIMLSGPRMQAPQVRLGPVFRRSVRCRSCQTVRPQAKRVLKCGTD